MSRKEDTLRAESQVLALRAQGLTVDEIAEHPDVPITTAGGVSKAIRRALERTGERGLREYQALSLAQLDQVDAATAHLLTQPGVTPTDALRALDLRRKTIESRGKILGHLGRAAELSAKAIEDELEAAAPDAGRATVVVVHLDRVPRDVLPPMQVVGTVSPDQLTIGLHARVLGAAMIRTSARDGRFLLGNALLEADPEECGPLIEYLMGPGGDDAFAPAPRRMDANGVDDELIVDPE